MFAGLLNERIDIMKYVSEANNYGEMIDTLVKEYTTRAKVVHLSGSRTLRNDEIQYPYVKQFFVRYHTPVTEKNLIKWDNKLYRILSIDRNRERQQIGLMCEIVNE